jgi:adsorption protein B
MNGWRETISQLYWFWRDRKGLISNLLGPVMNAIFLYGLIAWWASGMTGSGWRVILNGKPWMEDAFGFSIALQAIHLGVRMRFSARIYGWKFASAVPARVLLGNVINSLATASAIYRYFHAKWRRQPLVWLKTEHAYPSRAVLASERRRLGEILVGLQRLTAADLETALAAQPAELRLGEYLVHLGKLTEQDLYQCLSLQQSVGFEVLERSQVSAMIARSLPAEVSCKWKVLGFKVEDGELFVAGPDVPSEAMSSDLRRFSSLEIRFHLVTPENFESLQREFLSHTKAKSAGAA